MDLHSMEVIKIRSFGFMEFFLYEISTEDSNLLYTLTKLLQSLIETLINICMSERLRERNFSSLNSWELRKLNRTF